MFREEDQGLCNGEEDATPKAIVYRNYGSPDVLHCEDVDKPSPGDDQVLIRIRAAAANPLDYHLMGGAYLMRLMTGLRKPKPTCPGADLAGEVEAVGRNVTRFHPGDPVFGAARGAFAEYACPPENRVALKPANLTFEQAAAIPVAGVTALQGLRDKGRIQKVLVLSRFVGQHVVFFIAKIETDELIVLRELIEANKVTPIIDRRYTLSEAPEAIRYLKEGHARGKVVITVP